MPDDIGCVKRIVLNESMGNSLKLLILKLSIIDETVLVSSIFGHSY
jgi:hypothetical protein